MTKEKTKDELWVENAGLKETINQFERRVNNMSGMLTVMEQVIKDALGKIRDGRLDAAMEVLEKGVKKNIAGMSGLAKNDNDEDD